MSSSGHLILLEGLLSEWGYHIADLNKVFCESFEQLFCIDVLFHLLHGPTMMVVALFFFNQWFFLLRNFRRCFLIIGKIIALTAFADSITAIFFIVLKLFPQVSIPLCFGFFITGLLLYSLRWCQKGTASLNWQKALILGCVQGCALLPGISRLAAVYVTARWLGMSTRRAFEVAWLVQWPLIFAAFTHAIYILSSDQQLIPIIFNTKMLITVLIASICAYLLLAFVNYLAQKNQLWKFSWYMPIPVFICLTFYT